MTPPFTGVAVNITLAPTQKVFPEFETILTLGATMALTNIVKLLLVAARGDAHDKLLVTTQLMISLLASALFEYVLLLVPTLVPFFFH